MSSDPQEKKMKQTKQKIESSENDDINLKAGKKKDKDKGHFNYQLFIMSSS